MTQDANKPQKFKNYFLSSCSCLLYY